MRHRLWETPNRRGLRRLLIATAVLAGVAAVALSAALEPAVRADHRSVYNAPGKLSSLVSDGTRVAAFVSAQAAILVVLWHPGEPAVTAPAGPAGSRLADLQDLHFDGGNVVWSNADLVTDWEWSGHGKARVADHPSLGTPPTVNVACVRGGRVENHGRSLVFIPQPARYEYIAPGAIDNVATDGTRVAALVISARNEFVVLWHPGEPPLTRGPARPDFNWDLRGVRFEGQNVVWSAVVCGNFDCYRKDATWDGDSTIRWTKEHLTQFSGPPRVNVVRVQGGRVHNCGNGLVFIARR